MGMNSMVTIEEMSNYRDGNGMHQQLKIKFCRILASSWASSTFGLAATPWTCVGRSRGF
jgi:hypothetical protein